MTIIWAIFCVGMILAVAGILKNNNVILYIGSILWLGATFISLIAMTKRYKKYTYQDDERAIDLFLAQQRKFEIKDESNEKQKDLSNKPCS